MPEEKSLEDRVRELVASSLQAERKAQADKEAADKDPMVRLTQMVQKAVHDEFATILGASEGEGQQSPKDQGGFLEWITGGKREEAPK